MIQHLRHSAMLTASPAPGVGGATAERAKPQRTAPAQPGRGQPGARPGPGAPALEYVPGVPVIFCSCEDIMPSPSIEKRSQTEETIQRHEDVLEVNLWYPLTPLDGTPSVTTVEVGLID